MTNQVYRAKIGEANHIKLIRLPDGTFAIGAALYTDDSAQGIIPVRFGDSASLDAFGRQRVSNPVSRFYSQQQYNEGLPFWETVTAGGGSITHLPNESSTRMDVGTASGDSVIRQTREYHRYQPGRSQSIQATFVFDTPKANLYQYVGYGDAQNGIFLETRGTETYLNLRSFVTGSAVDGRVARANWNIDPFDGNGPSGVVLDITKRQIFIIDLEWLAVGRVRVGFNINGINYYAHEFLHANNGTTAYMTTANLPVEYGIVNLDTVASASSMKHICVNVDSEGGYENERGCPFSASNGTALISVTTRRPVLSIRPKLTFNSITNRAHIIPHELHFYNETNSVYVEIIWGGTLTGASFNSVAAESVTEYDVAATAIAGGVRVWSGIIPAAGPGGNAAGGLGSELTCRSPLTLSRAGAHPTTPYTDILSVVATSVPGAGAPSGASLNWRELR